MKQQVVVIHGGNAYENYDEYIENLRLSEISLERLRSKDWKDNLGKDLGADFDVLTPRMPNSNNARFLEWKIWFEKLIPLLDEDIIFVGHSLGGIFLAKYLSENNYPKNIKATLLVAAPYNTPTNHPLVDFTLITPWDKFVKQGGKIILYHSKDDQVVYFDSSKFYLKELPKATLRIFEDKGHFNTDVFPEVIEDFKTISN